MATKKRKAAKNKRTLFRWLTEKLGCCTTGSRRFARLTPEQAWDRASPYDRFTVMREVGFPHTERSCPVCNASAKANETLPPKVLNAFRRWQSARSL